MNVVIDTKVIVSAVLSPKGSPAQIVDFIIDTNEIQIYYSADILTEYKEVLSRPRLNIDDEMIDHVVNLIKKVGVSIEATPSAMPMPDEADRIFYDTARAAGAILITGNIKHYPAESFIMTPVDFLKKVESR